LTVSNRKKVLIAGASSGVGAATALRFAAEGWDVCLNARRRSKLLEIREGLPSGHHLVCPGDFTDRAAIRATSQTIQRDWGCLDVLINSVGVYAPVDAINDLLEKWREVFDTMVNGAIYLTRMAVPLMKEGGRIIYITSIHGQRATAGASSYSMAKAALNQYARSLAVDLAPQGILVNAIAPGFLVHSVTRPEGVKDSEAEDFQRKRNEHVQNRVPLRRAGQPEEVAGVAFFLAGPDASYITGQVLTVDGGLTIAL
jgi:NAD(P)-dependent dehydrogenase (short-subunit alcohol dehydrogenase family)